MSEALRDNLTLRTVVAPGNCKQKGIPVYRALRTGHLLTVFSSAQGFEFRGSTRGKGSGETVLNSHVAREVEVRNMLVYMTRDGLRF